jgi:septal ring factor EnvC (AmiA/AmiB activator)
MALFAKHSDAEYLALEKELAATRSKLAEIEATAAAELAQKDASIAAAEQTIKAQADAKAAEINKAKDLQEENDLLLAQLHQVQEELERYYLNNKDLEAGLGEATTTLQLARQSLVKTLVDTRGYVLAPNPPPTFKGAQVVKLPARLSPPKSARSELQRTSARKSSKSR